MLRPTVWWIQNGSITRNGVLPVTILFFWIFCFSLRTSYKELISFTNDPNGHVRTFCKCYSFIWRCFFPVTILNIPQADWPEVVAIWALLEKEKVKVHIFDRFCFVGAHHQGRFKSTKTSITIWGSGLPRSQ